MSEQTAHGVVVVRDGDLFPDRPTYDELMDDRPSESERIEQRRSGDAHTVDSDEAEWYNDAVFGAARLIIEAAIENQEFREAFLDDDGVGAAHEMAEYDEDRFEKLNTMGLSAFQGGSAENLARTMLLEDEVVTDGIDLSEVVIDDE